MSYSKINIIELNLSVFHSITHSHTLSSAVNRAKNAQSVYYDTTHLMLVDFDLMLLVIHIQSTRFVASIQTHH